MKTVTVQLVQKTQIGTDGFNEPIYSEELINVPGVLVGQPTSDQILNTNQLYGKFISFVLGIPKGDTNNWIDAEVYVFGERYRTIGYPEEGIPGNIPLKWGKNVKVERYG